MPSRCGFRLGNVLESLDGPIFWYFRNDRKTGDLVKYRSCLCGYLLSSDRSLACIQTHNAEDHKEHIATVTHRTFIHN
ncbi:MAG: hypothetical protein ACETWK_00945 [Candidatus Aminicenantaceae bacterium]